MTKVECVAVITHKVAHKFVPHEFVK